MDRRVVAVLSFALALAAIVLLFLRHDRPEPGPTVDARDAGPTAPPGPAIDKTTKPRPVPHGILDGGLALGDGGVARAQGTTVLKGAWGGGPGQFGRKHDPESN